MKLKITVPRKKTTRYVIKNCGFVKETMTDEEFDQINYEVLASQLKEMIDDYQRHVSEAELQNKKNQ